MADTAESLPDEMVVAEPPLSDADLDAWLDYADRHDEASTEDPGAHLADVAEHPQDFVPEAVAALPVHRWLIDSLDDAEWAMSTLATAQSHVRELAEQRDEWMRSAQDRIDHWYRRASRRSTRTAQVMAAKLERYALEQRALDPKVKSIPLPSGVVKTTEAKAKPKVVEDGLVAATVHRAIASGGVDSPWYKALQAAEVKMDDLIVESTKVYAAPFAKLVTVAEVPTGEVAWVLGMSCGHELEVHTEDGTSEPADPRLGESLTCSLCDPDPIDGPKAATVVELERIPLTEWRVLGPDGQPVPGTAVEQGSTTAKAVPGA